MVDLIGFGTGYPFSYRINVSSKIKIHACRERLSVLKSWDAGERVRKCRLYFLSVCTFGAFCHEYANDIDSALSWYKSALGCCVESDKFTSVRTLYYYCIPYLRLGEMYKLKNDEKRSYLYMKKALEHCKKH